MNLIEYFTVIDEDGLRAGPFETLEEATGFLRKFALNRGYTHEQADQFFLHESAVVKVQTSNGRSKFFNLGWKASEKQKRESDVFARKRDRFAAANELFAGRGIEP
jgi:hypothetical protein